MSVLLIKQSILLFQKHQKKGSDLKTTNLHRQEIKSLSVIIKIKVN